MCKFELTCKTELTCEGTSTSQEPTLTHETGPLTDEEELLTMLTAVANPLRLRVIAELAEGRVHVSELARPGSGSPGRCCTCTWIGWRRRAS